MACGTCVENNAYRVLGISGLASEEEIKAAAFDIHRRMQQGGELSTPWDVKYLGDIVRTKQRVRDALLRLRDPMSRVLERLFWFHTSNVVAGSDWNALVDEMERRDQWGGTANKHDAGLIDLITEWHEFPEGDDTASYLPALDRWHQVVKSDAYWGLVLSIEGKGGFHNRVTVDNIASARAQAFWRGYTLFLDSVGVAFRDGKRAIGETALETLCGDDAPIRDLEQCEIEVLAQESSALASLCGAISHRCERVCKSVVNPNVLQLQEFCTVSEAAKADFVASVVPRLTALEAGLGAQTDAYLVAKVAAAACLESIGRAYRCTGDRQTADALLGSGARMGQSVPPRTQQPPGRAPFTRPAAPRRRPSWKVWFRSPLVSGILIMLTVMGMSYFARRSAPHISTPASKNDAADPFAQFAEGPVIRSTPPTRAPSPNNGALADFKPLTRYASSAQSGHAPGHGPVDNPANSPGVNPAPVAVENRPENGAETMNPRGATGRCQLTVDNGTGQDALVKLREYGGVGRTVRCVYVRSGEQTTLEGIGKGDYRLLFVFGDGYIAAGNRFASSAGCYMADNVLSFTETYEDNGVRYTVETVTLHDVVNGNMTKSDIPQADFDNDR